MKIEIIELIDQLTRQGVYLEIKDKENIAIRGSELVVQSYLDKLKENKADLIKYLQSPVRSLLSWGQSGIWSESQKDTDHPAYNITIGFRVPQLDLQKSEQACRELIRIYSSLSGRYALQEETGELFHYPSLKSADDFNLSVHLGEDMSPTHIKELCEEFGCKTFDLQNELPFRVLSIQNYGLKGDEEHYLVWSFHHICVDLLSIELVLSNFENLYRGMSIFQEEASYASFVRKQYCEAINNKENAYFWESKLKDIPLSRNLYIDKIKRRPVSSSGKIYNAILPHDLQLVLKEYCSEYGITPHNLLLGTYLILLQRYSGNVSVPVYIPTLNREESEYQTVGYFCNILPIWMNQELKSIKEIFLSLEKDIFNLLEHQSYPIAKIMESGKGVSGQDIQYMFVYHQFRHLFKSRDSYIWNNLFYFAQHNAPVDLMLTFNDLPDGYHVQINYNSEIFDHFSISHFYESYVHTLEQICSKEIKNIVDVEIISPIQKNFLFEKNDYPTCDRNIIQFIEQAWINQPAKIAVDSPFGSITYNELWHLSGQFAKKLQSKGVKANIPVAVYMERKPDLIVAMLGILRAGGYYLPLDPRYPRDRMLYVLEQAKCSLIVTDYHSVNQIDEDCGELIIYL